MQLPEGLTPGGAEEFWQSTTAGSAVLACLFFDEGQNKVLMSLLGLMRSYLRHDWQVREELVPGAEVVVVNLDAPEGRVMVDALRSKGRRVFGCARRPREHPAGTLHRPFRGYQILALLKEAERRGAAHVPDAGGAPEVDRARRFQLLAWPSGFLEWPRSWWRVMAAVRTSDLSLQEIASRCELPEAEVSQCLETLLERQMVGVRFDMELLERPQPPRPRSGLWKRLGTRVSAILGRR